MQARFYLPMYHRFASPDPGLDQHFQETQSWNIYSYVMNNPIMSVDPTGMVAGDPDFVDGIAHGLSKALTLNHTERMLNERGTKPENTSFKIGEVIGDLLAIPGGNMMAMGGLGIAAQSPLEGPAAPVAIVAGGALAIEGMATSANGIVNAVKDIAFLANGGRGSTDKGKEGEQKMQAQEDTGNRESYRGQSGQNRVSDGSTPTTVNESKNSVYQAYTKQLKDGVAHAKGTGRIFQLFTPKAQTQSAPLAKAIKDGVIVHKCY